MDTIFPYCCKLLGEGQGEEDGRGRGGKGGSVNWRGAKSVCRSALPPPP